MNYIKAFVGCPLEPGDYVAVLETIEDYRALMKRARDEIGDRDIVLIDGWVKDSSHPDHRPSISSLGDVKDFLKIRECSNFSNSVKYAVIEHTNNLREAREIITEENEELNYVSGGTTREELAEQIGGGDPDGLEHDGWVFDPVLTVAWR